MEKRTSEAIRSSPATKKPRDLKKCRLIVLFESKQALIDRSGSLESPYVDNDINKRVEIFDGVAIAYFWSFDLLRFGLAIDAFARSALVVNGAIEWPGPIQGDAHQPALLTVDIFDTAFAFLELLMLAGFLRRRWMQ